MVGFNQKTCRIIFVHFGWTGRTSRTKRELKAKARKLMPWRSESEIRYTGMYLEALGLRRPPTSAEGNEDPRDKLLMMPADEIQW